MCGIAGLFLKDKSLEPELGAMLSDMLVTLTDRGPDSAGIAIYGAPGAGSANDVEHAADFALFDLALKIALGCNGTRGRKGIADLVELPHFFFEGHQLQQTVGSLRCSSSLRHQRSGIQEGENKEGI